MNAADFVVGAYVRGGPFGPRQLVNHAKLLTAYAVGVFPDDSEAYLSHYLFDKSLIAHHRANRGSVAGYNGSCYARWLTLDIDRPSLDYALADARKLAGAIAERYHEEPIIHFSGGKGFHLAIDLSAAGAEPAVGLPQQAKAFALGVAALASVKIDESIFDIGHIIRLPNSRHGKSGLFKRRISLDELYRLGIDAIRDLARCPSEDGFGPAWRPSARMADDWRIASRAATEQTAARAVVRQERSNKPDKRCPKYLLDFLRFGAEQGERHVTLFRCAAWLHEQGAPPSLVHALLTEPGCDVGLTPKDVDRQIRCGIEHAQRQRAVTDPRPDPDACPCRFEAWAIRHEDDPLPPGALDFPFGANESEGGPP